MKQIIEQAAQRLLTAAATATPCAPVRDLLGEHDQELAYEVQESITRSRLAAGARVVGRKIGLTSRAVQEQLGVPSPDFGTLLDDMVHADREPLPLERFLQPRIEGEVAFVLGRDITSATPTVADIIGATDYLLPAIEVVDSRIAGWDIRITDTIADNASSGALVLGTRPVRPTQVDLPTVGMVLEHRGNVVSAGAGVACAGSPVAAVTWLAKVLARRETPLRAGDIVLSGALGPVVPVQEPGTYRLRVSGLGEVSSVFVSGGVS
ncbi:MAG TPA: fumarylacetoacetate hydrolase family protein [Nocardiopsis listeri]|uniref:2-keto-4-pentenoate hydratase n=1 Tax=Nocardiopsis listeri TaxID=53440 RepID=UPI001DF4129A|nr:fumarylacetoacetate hydrolase family protein [Nocardiopsis listeri]HJE60933.1 fumarylacetoacetate hydrolase family protein [Nocardiopsis listeri]